MYVQLVFSLSFLHFHSSHAVSYSTCDSSDVCKHYKECKSYKEAVKQYKEENNIQNKRELGKYLRSRVCNKESRFVCCPDDEEINRRQSFVSPTYLPTSGECGKVEEKAVPLIFGGGETEEGQFSFAALVGVAKKKHTGNKKGKYTAWVCGGTLINLWYVVTAAHCHQEREGRMITRVRLGEWNIGGDDSLVQDFDILAKDITVHERYKHSTYLQFSITSVHHDIALIRLPTAAQLNTQVGVVCLALSESEVAKKLKIHNLGPGLVGELITFVGWGYTGYQENSLEFLKDDGFSGSRKQKSLEMSVLHKSECQAPILSDMFCAGGLLGQDICKGDSGGGAFMRESFAVGGHWYFFGIGSSGSRFCGSGKPRIFTRISKYIPWIKDNLID